MLNRILLSSFAVRAMATGSILTALAAMNANAGVVIPIQFEDGSVAQAGNDVQRQSIVNACSVLSCGDAPTAANAGGLNTQASASTDGKGGSRLSLESFTSNIVAISQTSERGRFLSTGAVDVQVHSFFPAITLFGVFSEPDSYVLYEIEINLPESPAGLVLIQGSLDSLGYHDPFGVGGTFDSRHHTVTLPPFFLNVDLGVAPAGFFSVELTKTLNYIGKNNVEAVRAEIIDPFSISTSPLRAGLVFTEVDGVPEPATYLLVGAALGVFAAARRRTARARTESLLTSNF